MSAQFDLNMVRGKPVPAGVDPLQFRDDRATEFMWRKLNAQGRSNAEKVSRGGFLEQMNKALREGLEECSEVQRAELFEEHEWLRKSLDGVQSAGFQTPVSGGNDLTPLVLQSIDDQLTEFVFRLEALNFVGTLNRARATNTVHEWRPLTSRGNEYRSAARVEGLTGGNDQTVTDYGAVRLKSYVNRREITDVLGSLTGVGVSTSLLNLETTNATMLLRQALEFDSLYGDASANALEFTGAIPSIVAQGNYTDMHDANGVRQLSLPEIEERLRYLETDKYFYARPTHVWAPPRVLSSLSKEINPQLRQDNEARKRTAAFGADAFEVRTSQALLPVGACQMLGTWRDRLVPTAPSADANRPSAPSVSAAAGSHASSRFFANDAGDYKYVVVKYNSSGGFTPATGGNIVTVTVAADDRVALTINDDADTDTTVYYQVYRTGKDVTDATTAQWIGKFARGAVGVDTVIYDYNYVLPGHFDVIITQQDPSSMEMVQLLDLMRVPLAKVEMTTPFAVFTNCALAMKAPQKMWVFRNVPPPSNG